jgi:adenine-specific DNA-methyltransferase
LDRGKRLKVHEAYLTSHRSPWYSVEDKAQSKIWSSVFGRNGLKFMWNETDALTLTSFHNFYPTKLGKSYMDILFIYLSTSLAKKLFENEKREYGGGLEKFEPNDINKSYIIDFKLLPEKKLEQLRKLQIKYLKSSQAELLAEAEDIFRLVSEPAAQ